MSTPKTLKTPKAPPADEEDGAQSPTTPKASKTPKSPAADGDGGTPSTSKTANQPPFGVEYAKSGRSSCKACQDKIPQGALRMAIRTPSRHFDGLQDNWFHYECFWKRTKSDKLDEPNIRGMESLKWEDQEKIRERIVELKELVASLPPPKSHIPKAELAKTSAGKCNECKEKISKGEVRIQFKSSNYHPACLKRLDAISCGAEDIEGYDLLDDEQKQMLVEVFGRAAEKKRKASEDEPEAAPAKKKAKVEGVDEELKEHLKVQSETLWQVRADITKHLSREEIDAILQVNGRYRRKKDGPDATIEHLADCIVFGVPEACKECEEGILFYSPSQHTYKCTGKIAEDTPCPYESRNPPRTAIKVPKSIKTNNKFLNDHKFPELTERYYALGTEVAAEASPVSATKSVKKIEDDD